MVKGDGRGKQERDFLGLAKYIGGWRRRRRGTEVLKSEHTRTKSRLDSHGISVSFSSDKNKPRKSSWHTPGEVGGPIQLSQNTPHEVESEYRSERLS